MNTKKKTIKSILGCTALLLGGVGAMNMVKPNYETYATGVGSIPVSITNANFNTSTQSSYPYSPSGYNEYNHGQKVTSSDNIEANVEAGVINLTSESYESRFVLAKRTSLDNYVLMIDSTDKDNNSVMHTVNYGFQTSSSVTLEANSKYMFTVDVFTATNANIANLYLFDANGEVFSSIDNINSYNNWTTYTFFVATNNMETVELKLGMYLEGAGTVLFDNISAFKLSDSEYNLTLNSAVSGTFSEENESTANVVKTFNISNDNKLTDSSNSTSFTNVEYQFESNSLSYVKDSDGKNDNAILIKSTEKTFSQYETDEIFTFEQNKIYKVSIKVKTNNLDGTASLQMIRTDIDEEDEDYDADNHNKSIKITSNTVSTSESLTNDYKTYSFLINSHSSKTLTYKLKFGLGLSDSLTSGEMYLSEIEVSKIDYETYNSASTGSGTEKINFVDVYSDSSIMLDNGDFNGFKIADYSSPMPATPIDWTVTTGNNTQTFGVVNTQTFENDLYELNLSNLNNPSSSENNNILMMYNATADTLSYKSESKTLSAKTYHKFEIEVQTQNAPLTISLVSTKDDNEIVLSSKTVNTNYSWETISFYVHSGYHDIDVSLKLTLQTESYGYAYVDNAKFNFILTSTQLENEFNTASNSTYSSKIDLTEIISSASNDKFATAQHFTSEKVSGVESGTITLNSTYLDEVIENTSNFETFNSLAELTDQKVLSIWTTEYVNYKMISNLGFALTSDKYYKISIAVYTQGLNASETSTDASLMGAGIKLSGFDNSFTSIQSNNEWTTYTFYIQLETDTTTYLELSLGNAEALTKGAVFFGNIEFVEDITASEYNAATISNTVQVVKPEATTDTDDSSTDEENDDTNGVSNTTWIYLIPSILTALAIIIAIVGFAVRKIKWKKPTKKSKNAYDRNKTVSVQYYTRKATTLREQKVRELNVDLEKINAERKQYEDVYKQDLTKLREMKIKRANPNEIAKLEKDLKKNQKISSSLGVTANRISDELRYAQTDAYLSALVKKLSREQSTLNENKTEN